MRHLPRGPRGFTLIELLVALAIVSLVAVLSWQGLDNVIRLTQRVRQSDDQWEQMRATLAQLEKDLKNVPNPRAQTTQDASSMGSGTQGSGQAGAGSNNRGSGIGNTGDGGDLVSGRQRADGRDDVIIENDENLDAVVKAVMATTQRVQLRDGGLELLINQASPRTGIQAVRIRWQLRAGQLQREQLPVVQDRNAPPDAQVTLRAANPGLARLFDEPGLRVKGVGLRVWTEGRGWDAEQYLGQALPPEPARNEAALSGNAAGAIGSSMNAPAGNTLGTGANNAPIFPGNPSATGTTAGAAGASGPIRLRGLQLRLWLPSGEIYTRVFVLGQES